MQPWLIPLPKSRVCICDVGKVNWVYSDRCSLGNSSFTDRSDAGEVRITATVANTSSEGGAVFCREKRALCHCRGNMPVIEAGNLPFSQGPQVARDFGALTALGWRAAGTIRYHNGDVNLIA